MTFMRKFLEVLKIENPESESKEILPVESDKNEFEREKEQILSNFRSKIKSANRLIDAAQISDDKEKFYNYINEIRLAFSEFAKNDTQKKTALPSNKHEEKNAYDKYYENINKQKENNLHITYEDVKVYDKKPFDLSGKFISDKHFTAIEISGDNLKIAYKCLDEINHMLLLHKYLYEDAELPEKINTEYILNRKLPVSHLRLIPYTATMRKSKYPLCLWLSNTGEYGTEYIYAIYFNKEGNIGQCELSLHGSEGIGISYETKIRRNDDGLYILRISKTLYSPPYGTTTIYHHMDSDSANREPKINSNYDLERYARECNAYVVCEERKEQNNS